MEHDKITEKFLKEKLSGYKVDPPADMWARISSSLGHAGMPTAEGQSPQIDLSGSSRRLKRRRLSWVYPAAACFMAGVMATVFLTMPDGQPTVADNTGDHTVVYDPFGTENPSGVDIEVVGEVIPDQSRSADGGSRFRIAAGPGTGPQGEGNLTTAAETEEQAERSSVTEPVGTGTGTGNTDGATQQRKEDNTRDKTSDMKGRGGSADYERAFAEENQRRRRNTPVSTSLFASNAGTNPSSGNRAGASIANSSLAANAVYNGSTLTLTQRLKHRMPLSFGANVDFRVTERFSVGTGLMYTYLYSESEGSLGSSGGTTQDLLIRQKLHYLGIPVNFRFDLFRSNRFSVYVGAGAMGEHSISAKWHYRVRTHKADVGGGSQTTKATETVNISKGGLQFSANVVAGAELRLFNSLGLYAEPGMAYYFENSKQPESYRTEHPFNFSFRAGLRFTIN